MARFDDEFIQRLKDETDIVRLIESYGTRLKDRGIVAREAVSNWAKELREGDDRQELTITPESDKPRIWKAILFLEGVDMKDAPDSYLHNEEDIRRERP